MSLIVPTAGTTSAGAFQIIETTLTAADTLAYVPSTGQLLKLRNPTAGTIVVTIVGSAPVSPVVPGTGTTFNTLAGKTISVTAGNIFSVSLDKISAYLGGGSIVNVTGGAGCFASLVG